MYPLYVRGVPYPLLCRAGTSDRWAFGQVFVRQEYGIAPADLNPELILDCGANVGYTSVYFLTQFPHAHVIAIEADERNLGVLQRNLAPYGNRARVIHAGLWSDRTQLRLCDGQRASKGEWGSWVRECQPGELPDVMAVDVQTVLDDSGFDSIDILKIDIEGAEAVVFSKSYRTWIDHVQTFLIELHGPECTEVFRRALEGRAYAFSQRGEVTVATRFKGRRP